MLLCRHRVDGVNKDYLGDGYFHFFRRSKLESATISVAVVFVIEESKVIRTAPAYGHHKTIDRFPSSRMDENVPKRNTRILLITRYPRFSRRYADDVGASQTEIQHLGMRLLNGLWSGFQVSQTTTSLCTRTQWKVKVEMKV